MTNITPLDHIDRHGTIIRYTAAKARILENQRSSDVAILNEDDAAAAALLPRATAHNGFLAPTSRARRSLRDRAGALVSGLRDDRFPSSQPPEISLPGIHNLENAMGRLGGRMRRPSGSGDVPAACATAGLPHRSRKVAVIGEVAWINDSKGTNPDATAKSLAGVHPDRTWSC